MISHDDIPDNFIMIKPRICLHSPGFDTPECLGLFSQSYPSKNLSSIELVGHLLTAKCPRYLDYKQSK